MNRRKRTIGIALVLLLLTGAFGLWLKGQQRQYARNRQLIAALVKNDDKQALTLVHEGADPNTHYKPTPMPLLLERVRQLFHRSPPTVNDSPTAFLIACGAPADEEELVSPYRFDDARLIEAMLKHGANVNEKDKNGRSALMFVSVYFAPDRVRLLLEHGAEVNTKDKYGNTPLMDTLWNPSIVPLLLEHGANVNAENDNGDTPLTSAIKANDAPEVVRLLLKHGADANAKDKYGQTPLMCAVSPPASSGMVRLLLEYGVDVNAKDNHGWTPLMHAAAYDATPDVLRLLLEHKADVNTKDKDGWTPLMHARKNSDTIALLQHAGARK